MSEEEEIKFRAYLLILNSEFPIHRKKEAMEELIKIYNKQQKEIEEWQKAYVRENNYWLKFRNKINKIANNEKDCSDNEVIKAVKNLEKENDKLTKLLLGKSLGFNDYISKDKIREHLKKFKEIEKEFIFIDNKSTAREINKALIEFSKRLLEE